MHPTYQILQDGNADTREAARGKDIFYRCTRCDGIIPSNPNHNTGCACGNLFIDRDYFRLSVAQKSAIRILRRLSAPKP